MRVAPVLHHGRACRLGVRRGHEPPVRVVGAAKASTSPSRRCGERFAVPVVAAGAGPRGARCAPSVSARARKAPPAWISGSCRSSPTSTSFAPAALAASRKRRQVARADHAGLVDDQHRARRQPHALVEREPQARDRRRLDAGLVAQLARRARRQRAAEHRDAAPPPGFDRCAERVRLAGSRRRPHHLDAVARSRQRDDERTAARRSGSDAPRAPTRQRRARRHRSPEPTRALACREETLFDLEADSASCTRSRPAPRPRCTISGDARNVVARSSMAADRRTARRRVGEGLQHVAAGEARLLAGQLLGEAGDVGLLDSRRQRTAHEAAQRGSVEPVLGRSGAPVGAEPFERDVVLLAPARLERGDLRRACRVLVALGHVRQDLRAPLREVLDHRDAARRRCRPSRARPRSIAPAAARSARLAARPGRGSRRSSRAGRAAAVRARVQRPSSPCATLPTTTCVCSSGSPARDVRCRNAAATNPRPRMTIAPPCPRRARHASRSR